MGAVYRHLSKEDRISLSLMLEKKYSKSKIARLLNVHRSTIYREIKRNRITNWASGNIYYAPTPAQNRYEKRRIRGLKLERNEVLRSYVHDKSSRGWSPWQIEGRLKVENEGKCLISHETIYHYIYSRYNIRNRFYKCLRRKHFVRTKRHARKPRIPKELLINNRPQYINTREDFGHWECDLMIFKQGIKSNLITLRERQSRYLIVIKNANKTARGTALAIIASLKTLKHEIKSITFDQGGEFLKFPWIRDCLETKIYFCHPASPQEKGSIENGNGLIRVELPRSHNIDLLHQENILSISDEINNRPLKCLNYKTPQEAFSSASLNNRIDWPSQASQS